MDRISVKLSSHFYLTNYFILFSYATTYKKNVLNKARLKLFCALSQNALHIQYCLSSPEERPLCQTAFELVAFEGPR